MREGGKKAPRGPDKPRKPSGPPLRSVKQAAALTEAIRLLWSGTLRLTESGVLWRLRSAGHHCRPRVVSTPHNSGYVVAAIELPTGPSSVLIHRLVWTYFVGPIPDGLEVNHRNGVKTDNRLANLEVVTPRENKRHAREDTKVTPPLAVMRGEAAPAAKLTRAQVVEIRIRYSRGGVSQHALGREFGVSQASIFELLHGLTWGPESLG